MEIKKRLLLCGLLCGVQAAIAGPLGSFAMSGQITVNGLQTITWNSDVSPFTADMFTLSEGAGIYSGENGQNQVETLTNPPEVIGSDFTPTDFINFLIDPTQSSLDINFIYPGTGGSAGCTATPNTSGTQTCTIPGSPFTFTNEQNGDSTATFTFAGITADGLDAWSGTFSANFLVPYQTIVASFISNPSNATATDTFAGTLDVNVSSVPEPGTIMMIGLGLLGIGASRKFRRS
jgi:PEP-CTERM motif